MGSSWQEPEASAAMAARRRRLSGVIEGYLQALAIGAIPDPREIIAAAPDLSEELEAFFGKLAASPMVGDNAAPNSIRLEEATVEFVPEPMGTLSSVRLKAPGDAPPVMMGDYELIEEIARGGMGVVYRARQKRLNRQVALKMILSGELASEDDIKRFHLEAEAAANLDHPGIVPVYEVGECEGRHFFSMGFVEGESLARRLARGPLPAREAACLTRAVADAIQYAHEQGVIHRDLKPGNILLQSSSRRGMNIGSSSGLPATIGAHSSTLSSGAACELEYFPKITDFGLAKRVAQRSDLTSVGVVVGTPSYMPPEQAAARNATIGPAADVYSLGALLYCALIGRPPFQAPTPFETLLQVMERDPVAPRQLNDAVPRDLETIVLKCLEKDPHRRYPSAAALGDELERYLNHHPITARPLGRLPRIARWCRRRPQTASLVVTGALLAIVAAAAMLLRLADLPAARARVEGRRDEIRTGTLYAASGAANMVLFRLSQMGNSLENAAENPELLDLVLARDIAGLQSHLQQLDDRQARIDATFEGGESEPFESMFVLDANGIGLARTPKTEAFEASDFSFRDYFAYWKTAVPDAESGAHVSRVYQSQADGLYKFALSVPLWQGDGNERRLAGVLAASVTTGSTLGLPRLHDERRKAVLVGRRDQGAPHEGRSSGSATGSPYCILVHPTFRHGSDAVNIEHPSFERLSVEREGVELRLAADDIPVSVDDYFDPVGERNQAYAGRWLAGFASVGNTELVAVVQQRFDDDGDAERGLTRDLMLWGAVALTLGIGLASATVLYGSRRAGWK